MSRARRLWGMIGAVALAACLVPVAAHGAGDSRAAATEHIMFLSNNPSETAKAVVIANGPIHAHGVDIVTGKHTDTLKFPKGSLLIRHKRSGGHDSYDPTTCLGTHTEHGTYTVTGGTGAYASATGHGKYHVNVTIVACRHHKPKLFQLQIKAAGPITL